MNALQIIPPKPLVRVRRSALVYCVSGAILLLAIAGGIGMSRGEEGTVAEGNTAVEVKENRDKAGDDKPAPVTQPAVNNDTKADSETATPPATAAAPAAPKKTTPMAMAARPVKPVRQASRPRGEAAHRSLRSADAVPAWAGPPPIIYGPPEMKRQEPMPPAPAKGLWERVVEAPGAVLNGGEQALTAVLDEIW